MESFKVDELENLSKEFMKKYQEFESKQHEAESTRIDCQNMLAEINVMDKFMIKENRPVMQRPNTGQMKSDINDDSYLEKMANQINWNNSNDQS